MSSSLTFHGGDIASAAKTFGISEDKWIDLSTGINPFSYPVPLIETRDFERLPYLNERFLTAIEAYYGHQAVPVAGSQEAIEHLPWILETAPVLLPDIGYKAYEKAFLEHHYTVQHYPALHKDEMLESLYHSLTTNKRQHLVIINPNNPTGVTLTKSELQSLYDRLHPKACLIVDEAFVDITPERSLLTETDLWPRCMVLRSFGKFFGLAGLRLGFIALTEPYRHKLEQKLNPWRINGPAQHIATEALLNGQWQQTSITKLQSLSEQQAQVLASLLNQFHILSKRCLPLFQSIILPITQSNQLFNLLGQSGVLARPVAIDAEHSLLRFGLTHQTKALQDRLIPLL